MVQTFWRTGMRTKRCETLQPLPYDQRLNNDYYSGRVESGPHPSIVAACLTGELAVSARKRFDFP